jgi:hypothetical protein
VPGEVLVAGAGLGDVVLGVGVDPVGVGVGDWLGAGSRSGSHCWAVPLVTAAVSDSAAEAVLLRLGSADSIAVANPVAAATSTPPVTKLAVTGRTCAKRMKALPVCCSLLPRERFFSMEWLHQAWHAQLARYAHHCTPSTVPSATVTTTQSVPN